MKNEKPLVTVIIPVYNGQDTLQEAVDSALAQEVPLYVYIIDDCSRDGTGALLEQMQSDPRIRVFYNETSLGAGGSRNRGVREAQTEYVAFLDADDLWRKGKLRAQLSVMKKRGTVLCCTGRELMRGNGEATGQLIGVKKTITWKDLLRHNSINCSSVLVRRDAAAAFPMEHEDAHEDYITWMKILKAYGPAAGVNRPYLLYRSGSGGKSGSKLQSARMTFLSYRYMGFGRIRSAICFGSYALNGVLKYSLAKWRSARRKDSNARC